MDTLCPFGEEHIETEGLSAAYSTRHQLRRIRNGYRTDRRELESHR